MSRGAIENLVPESSTTPTISSISSEISFEDVQSVAEMDSIDPKAKHPTLYEHDGMVTFKVEDVFFRKPVYFFTESSAYFVDYFREKGTQDIVELTNPDVSSCAFASLLQVLHPPLGVTPISTLAQWTDVLHLSSKWGFEHLRAAAVKAILPLASAVDKLVLGRKYGFDDWVPGAYVDLLEREEHLTMAEGKLMDLEDILAIARGRCEVRTRSVKPRANIEEVVKRLLPRVAKEAVSGEAMSSPSHEGVPPLASVPPPPGAADAATNHSGVVTQAQISHLVDQASSDPEERSVSNEGLLRLMQEDRTRIPFVLNTVLSCGLKQFAHSVERDGHSVAGRDDVREALKYTNKWDKGADGGRHEDLIRMDTIDRSLGLIRTPRTEGVCLQLVDHWRFLQHMDLSIPSESLIASASWKSFVCAVKYMAYLVDGPDSTQDESRSVVSSSVFSAFWKTLTMIHQSTLPALMPSRARATRALLESVDAYVSRGGVCSEMDSFYMTMKEAYYAAYHRQYGFRLRPFSQQDKETMELLPEIINARRWPLQ